MNQQLLEELRQDVKEMSVNSLGSIYPGQLMEWLELSPKELEVFIEDLHNERLVTYKYKFYCTCGNSCTAYYKKIQRIPYICKDCGKTFDLEEIIKNGTLVYEIDKKELLEFQPSEMCPDLLRVSDSSNRIVYLEAQQKNIKGVGNNMEIFLGSSQQAKDKMEKIGYILETMDHRPLLWSTAGAGIFVPNANTFDSLIQITKRVQAAVFIFNSDDDVWQNSALSACQKVRDNVLLEYGLFVGALSKSRVCFVCEGKPKLASDLAGVTYIDGTQGELTIKKKLQDWLNAM